MDTETTSNAQPPAVAGRPGPTPEEIRERAGQLLAQLGYVEVLHRLLVTCGPELLDKISQPASAAIAAPKP